MFGKQGEAVAYSWRWILDRLLSEASPVYDMAVAAAYASTPRSPQPAHRHFEGCAPNGTRSAAEAPVDLISADSPGPESRGLEQGSASDSAERDGRGSCMTVACVRWGDKYGVEYVERLALGVRRHLSGRHCFVCFTDDVEALRGMDGVEGRVLGEGCLKWTGWWNKAFIFSR